MGSFYYSVIYLYLVYIKSTRGQTTKNPPPGFQLDCGLINIVPEIQFLSSSWMLNEIL
ncbi:hypothetical protein SALLE_v1c01220 [Spiroplasma alleghenense]|uniref:Uncharacterized protein n=1 Tax=Spiroplasma alleghenense TaxID=216931 RepID=A0A345Z2G9_9MOLU|nr:hypothetical protein SALLE_v1c01220 [Spiroplasma alleghenense]